MQVTAGSAHFRGSGNGFLDDVLRGMSNEQKVLYSKYFYDDAGSRYFDQICDLEEYYPYRTELEMLPRVSRELAGVIEEDIDLVEFGAGSLVKVRPVLENLGSVRRYVPIDIAGEHLLKASSRLREDFSGDDFRILPVEADFTRDVELPAALDAARDTVRLGFFPGSTIGNFSPEQARELLIRIRQVLGSESWLLIGVDTKKSRSILHRAYNDADGVTARFNKNLLRRINRELNANFNLDNFEHNAFYNESKGRIEMHLVSMDDQEVSIDGRVFNITRGETIHTENSYKYSLVEFSMLARRAGWSTHRQWQDGNQLFSHHLLRVS